MTRPENYRTDNLIGNVISVIADRANLSSDDVIARLSAHYGKGDFDAAESQMWDRYFGPLCDEVMADAGIYWAP